jgi:nucleotide-binding universal stress UspA family protein
MIAYEKILIPVDFSPHSTFAVRLGADLARRFHGSVTLLYVHDPLPYALPDEYELFSPEQRNRLQSLIQKALAAAQQRAETAGAPSVQSKMLEGNPASEIVRFAEEGGFDLIVMGTHGRRGMQHAVLGSVAERVVRAAACPVLTARPPEELLSRGEGVWPTVS